MEKGSQNTRPTNGRGVVYGVLLLTGANLIAKVIGLCYKIPLSHLIGDEGMGYFNAAYTIYTWLYLLSTAGIPVALSILVSGARAESDLCALKRTGQVSFRILFFFGLVFSALLAFGRAWLSDLFGSADAAYAVLAIAPTLFFICIASWFRGYFQGFGEMAPTALSQVIEAAGKLLLGIIFAFYAARKGYPMSIVSAYAIFGVTVGTFFGVIQLAVSYLRAMKKGLFDVPNTVRTANKSGQKTVRALLRIALPVTVSASVMSLTNLIDLGLLIRLLEGIGYTERESTALYGNYTTLVVPLFHLPSVLVTPIASGIVPVLASSFASRDREQMRRISDGAFRASAVLSMPCVIGFLLFARPILALLYPADSAAIAYPWLMIIAPAVFFVCILSVSGSILQASGMAWMPMVSMTVGGIVKIVSTILFVSDPAIGMAGAPLGTLLCYATACILNLVCIRIRLGYFPSLRETVLRPLVVSALAGGGGYALWLPLRLYARTGFAILIPIAVTVVLYVFLSFLLGQLKKEDIASIPVLSSLVSGSRRRAKKA